MARIASLQDGPSTATRALTTGLGIDPATFSEEASQVKEDQLGLDRNQRRDVQRRLTGLGFDVKTSGKFDQTTRAVITRWQAARGYPKSGYLNALQHKALQQEILATRVVSAASDDNEPAARSSRRRGGGGGGSRHASIVGWAENQPDMPTLSEAIRRLVNIGLTVESKGRQADERQRVRAREMARRAVDSMTDATAHADDQVSRKRRLLKGREEFRKAWIDQPKRKN